MGGGCVGGCKEGREEGSTQGFAEPSTKVHYYFITITKFSLCSCHSVHPEQHILDAPAILGIRSNVPLMLLPYWVSVATYL